MKENDVENEVSDDKRNRLQLNSRMVMQFLQMRAVLLGYINRLNPCNVLIENSFC